jgi:GGDEF domain-containing protein
MHRETGALIHRLVADVDQARAKLEKIAHTDALTKLGNRFALEADFTELKGQGLMCMWDVNGLPVPTWVKSFGCCLLESRF